jgi:hypothetical protein
METNPAAESCLPLCEIEHRVQSARTIYLVVAGNPQGRTVMGDNVTLFPNMLQPDVALKAYAPLGVRFWENQGAALEALKEFSDGWFARRQRTTEAGLEAARRMGDAETHFDIVREYQNWLTGAMELLTEDGKAYQQQMLRVGIQLSPTSELRRSDERRAG